MPLHNRYFAALAVAAFLSGCGASSSGPLPAAGTEALQHRGSWMTGGLAGPICSTSQIGTGRLAFFGIAGAEGKPTLYKGAYNDHFVGCAFDDRGDLLAVATYGRSTFYTHFYYLPKFAKALIPGEAPRARQQLGLGDHHRTCVGRKVHQRFQECRRRRRFVRGSNL